MYFLEKVNTALQHFEYHNVLLKDHVGPNEGPWLVMDPVGGSSCESIDMIFDVKIQKYGRHSKFSPVGHLATLH